LHKIHIFYRFFVFGFIWQSLVVNANRVTKTSLPAQWGDWFLSLLSLVLYFRNTESLFWRECVGIEPTTDLVSPTTGFEDQEHHQAPSTPRNRQQALCQNYYRRLQDACQSNLIPCAKKRAQTRCEIGKPVIFWPFPIFQ